MQTSLNTFLENKMRKFNIEKTSTETRNLLIEKIDNLTKPKGSLGVLESLALQIGLIQNSLSPKLVRPTHIVFAADHGISDENISLSPKEITYQMVYNFLEGGAGVNFLARQHNFKLCVVDMGVDYIFPDDLEVVNTKIARGTENYLYRSAMTIAQAEQAIECAALLVDKEAEQGSNIISFGEIGISNTSASSIWMHFLTGIDLKECVGAGSDHTGGIIEHKYDVLKRSVDNYLSKNGAKDPVDIMCYFGGFEMVAAVGAMLRAAELKMTILVDGFIMTACAMMASKLNPNFLDYAIFGHEGDETGHKAMLRALNVKGILHLSLRLGEGTGAICAFPIVDSAVRMINEMSTFSKAEVTKYI